MKRTILTLAVVFAALSPTWAWSEEGHDASPGEGASGDGGADEANAPNSSEATEESAHGEGHDQQEAHGEDSHEAGEASTSHDEAAHGEPAEDTHGEGEHGEGTHGEHGEEAHDEHGSGGDHDLEIPLWAVIPFVLMLLCIAVLPLTMEHWWENNLHKFYVALLLGIPVGLWFYFGFGDANHAAQHELLHIMLEYVAFMFLLGSLYVISGGILLKGDLPATPRTNVAFLAVGTILASFMGTTGAAMLLIRPLLSTNKERRHKVHTVIFFTFLVANIGGSLTPLGDPPLFMGYLRGVPFTWTFNLTPAWAFTSIILLIIYYIWDTRAYRSEKAEDIRRDTREVQKLKLTGLINVPLLAGVVCSVAFGQWLNSELPSLGGGAVGAREVIMGLLAVASMVMTKKQLREDNEFTFAPILEVAALFLGIFLTMIPAVVLLKTRGGELPVTEPWHFFWATGTLSAFLDNTPTYVVFFELGASGLTPDPTIGEAMVAQKFNILFAISLGAVFMGAMTYIGNGPNFMVKAISDERGVKMPSFFGYMIYSCLILIPVFIVVTLIFLVLLI